MRISGIGIDLVEVGRVRRLLKRRGNAIKNRIFSPGEREYCERHKNSAEHYAGRIAAKEAVMKALGTGWAKGVGWLDIEVIAGRNGAPVVALHGKAAGTAKKQGIHAVHLSISHTRSHAVAWAIAERRRRGS